MTGAIRAAASAFGDLPRHVVIAAAAEIATGVGLLGLANLAASAGSGWGDVPIWLGVIGALGLVSGFGLLYQLRLARATSLAFGLVTAAGALIVLILGTPPSRWWTVIPLAVVAASALVIYGSGTLTVRRFGALLVVVALWVWVIPTATGPSVTCIDINPVACEETWRGEVARLAGTNGTKSIFPLTEVRVEGICPNMYLQWGPFGDLFGHYVEAFC